MADESQAVSGASPGQGSTAFHGDSSAGQQFSEAATPRSASLPPSVAHHSHGRAPGPDVGTGDPTDGRSRYDWQSHYPAEARSQIRCEACYVVLLLLCSFLLIFLSWKGIVAQLLAVSGEPAATLKKYGIYTSAGLLGGAVFGVKYLYRVVARGYWHMDRKLWRYLSPLNSSALALVMGAGVEASFVSVAAANSLRGALVFGFLVGYFADQAISKLHEIAAVVFGTTTTTAKAEERSKDQSAKP